MLPGLPAEMEAMFETLAGELRRENPIGSWRRSYRARESEIAGVLAEAGERWPDVLVGSYPSFHAGDARVEVVVKSSDPEELAAAAVWIESALEAATRQPGHGPSDPAATREPRADRRDARSR